MECQSLKERLSIWERGRRKKIGGGRGGWWTNFHNISVGRGKSLKSGVQVHVMYALSLGYGWCGKVMVVKVNVCKAWQLLLNNLSNICWLYNGNCRFNCRDYSLCVWACMRAVMWECMYEWLYYSQCFVGSVCILCTNRLVDGHMSYSGEIQWPLRRDHCFMEKNSILLYESSKEAHYIHYSSMLSLFHHPASLLLHSRLLTKEPLWASVFLISLRFDWGSYCLYQ